MPKLAFDVNKLLVYVRQDQREDIDRIADNLYEGNLSRAIRDLIDIALEKEKPTLGQRRKRA